MHRNARRGRRNKKRKGERGGRKREGKRERRERGAHMLETVSVLGERDLGKPQTVSVLGGDRGAATPAWTISPFPSPVPPPCHFQNIPLTTAPPGTKSWSSVTHTQEQGTANCRGARRHVR